MPLGVARFWSRHGFEAGGAQGRSLKDSELREASRRASPSLAKLRRALRSLAKPRRAPRSLAECHRASRSASPILAKLREVSQDAAERCGASQSSREPRGMPRSIARKELTTPGTSKVGSTQFRASSSTALGLCSAPHNRLPYRLLTINVPRYLSLRLPKLKFGPNRDNVGRCRANIGRVRANLGRCRANVVGFGPCSGEF